MCLTRKGRKELSPLHLHLPPSHPPHMRCLCALPQWVLGLACFSVYSDAKIRSNAYAQESASNAREQSVHGDAVAQVERSNSISRARLKVLDLSLIHI